MPPQIFLLMPKIVSPPPHQPLHWLCRACAADKGRLHLQQLGFRQQPLALAGVYWEESRLCSVPPAWSVMLKALDVLGAAGPLSLSPLPMEISLSRQEGHLGTRSSRKPLLLTLLWSEGRRRTGTRDSWASCQPPHLPLLQEKRLSAACSVPQFTQYPEGRHQMGSVLHTGSGGEFFLSR